MSWDYLESLDPFFERGLIDEVLYEVKSGKEATVFCCRSGEELVAAKVYRPRERRGFKNDSLYREGRVILDTRIRRAVAAKTAMGREAEFGLWVYNELEQLKTLHALGADVPRPIASAGVALLLEFIGDEDGPAPLLKHAELSVGEARAMLDGLLWNVERLLANNVVHGDLSPFNVLVWNGKATIIDFPQAVDPRFNHHSFDLLQHDVEQLCRHFVRYGVTYDAERLAAGLWAGFLTAEL
ncbi:MAG: RIO1 family regulatory kinase/ATPase [Dehalococcoidia bacterium]